MTKKKTTALITTLGILLVGANLRLPITMMPPLLPELKRTIGLEPALAGLLTTIPLIGFALFSPIMGQMGAKRGNERVLLGALIILSIGSYIRVIPSVIALIIGTIAIGVGIAGGNVLLPAIIKDQFPNSVAAKTTMYTSMQALIAAAGTGLAGAISGKVGPAHTMSILGLVGIAALIVWLIGLRNMKQPAPQTDEPRLKDAPGRSVWKAPLAWVIMLFFGLQSVLFYTLITWLPSLWHAAGFSTVAASTLTTIFMLGGLPASLLVPSVAERKHGLSALNIAIFAGFFLGAAGLLLGSTNFAFNVLLSLLMGLASGAAFSISIVFFQKRTDSPNDTARLSGMAQAGGYVLAAAGPVGIGIVQEATHSWSLLIDMSLILTIIIGIAGVIIVRRRSIFD